jgi:hypothetical protein
VGTGILFDSANTQTSLNCINLIMIEHPARAARRFAAGARFFPARGRAGTAMNDKFYPLVS